MNYVENYTDFSSKTSEQSGTYLALKVDSNADSVTVSLNGGKRSAVNVDSDGNAVIRVTDPSKQSVEVVATKGEETVKKTYDLKRLTLGELE